MLLQQQPLVLQSKGNYIIVKSWSLALIILSLKSTAHGYGIALISGNSSCQLLLLWGTWASLQSQEKSISPFGVGPNKKKPKSVCYADFVFLLFWALSLFSINYLLQRLERGRQRDQESLESEILQRECRGKRPESLESRAQRTSFFFNFFLCCGSWLQFFFFFFLLFS
jgi:hypothetical protein